MLPLMSIRRQPEARCWVEAASLPWRYAVSGYVLRHMGAAPTGPVQHVATERQTKRAARESAPRTLPRRRIGLPCQGAAGRSPMPSRCGTPPQVDLARVSLRTVGYPRRCGGVAVVLMRVGACVR
eukprot:TRINITY_DN12591_c0_g1_i1.p1 TRINITY_DN12591_c0_g1~~TRINITY_DN12591_c0_g1_i1.p1  ORF type:complete len:125 (-),score=1.42 TRINITY_DN12591_c0_g1_i1:588-962(-)